MLPSYIGILISQYKEPVFLANQDFMVHVMSLCFCFRCSNVQMFAWMSSIRLNIWSNEKWVPGCLGYIGDYTTVHNYVVIILSHYFRIPIKQPVFHGKSQVFFFFRGSDVLFQSFFILQPFETGEMF